MWPVLARVESLVIRIVALNAEYTTGDQSDSHHLARQVESLEADAPVLRIGRIRFGVFGIKNEYAGGPHAVYQ